MDEASSNGSPATGDIGICYQASGGKVSYVSDVASGTPASGFLAQTVSGDVGNLSHGSYQVGLCAEDQSANMLNEDAAVTITLAETASGITCAEPKAAPAKQRGAQ